MIDSRKLLLGLTLLLLALGSWWLTRYAVEPAAAPGTAAAREPDYVIENFVGHAMSERGTRKYLLAAERMLHYPHDDTAHFVKPVLVQHLPDGVDVTTRADTGIMPGDGREIVMAGEVHVTRAGGSGAASGEIRIERLRVELDR
jgi:lipopolysaccharide export system protein LptC